MTSVRYWHRRILEGRRGGDPEAARIYPHYMSFESGLRPEWWTDETPEDWGAVLGVHECTVGQEAGSIVVTEKGLAVLGRGGSARWEPYEAIGAHQRVDKGAAAQLVLAVADGPDLVLDLGPDSTGRALAFVQFVSGCRRGAHHLRGECCDRRLHPIPPNPGPRHRRERVAGNPRRSHKTPLHTPGRTGTGRTSPARHLCRRDATNSNKARRPNSLSARRTRRPSCTRRRSPPSRHSEQPCTSRLRHC